MHQSYIPAQLYNRIPMEFVLDKGTSVLRGRLPGITRSFPMNFILETGLTQKLSLSYMKLFIMKCLLCPLDGSR
jgi:hypothetical protein